MAHVAPSLPTRFPCWCRAVYSWGGESKRDLGFIEGDLIECLNAGDGSWWMGRLRRDKRAMGLFPSNFVQVLDESFTPVSRATTPVVSRNGSEAGSGPSPQKAKTPLPTPGSESYSPRRQTAGLFNEPESATRPSPTTAFEALFVQGSFSIPLPRAIPCSIPPISPSFARAFSMPLSRLISCSLPPISPSFARTFSIPLSRAIPCSIPPISPLFARAFSEPLSRHWLLTAASCSASSSDTLQCSSFTGYTVSNAVDERPISNLFT
ncbi:MAG: hypothetical protein FRX48_03339 [Lasallia pustulata]|uniref:SH3 domain-containing protein n=1 Tax=Lasallia pustulata TaxID=136370 RepID=A0A5M8PY13_9LECA|nr:MAG: hypothetical protein FRX48_03339 [Lasallia pustulata]